MLSSERGLFLQLRMRRTQKRSTLPEGQAHPEALRVRDPLATFPNHSAPPSRKRLTPTFAQPSSEALGNKTLHPPYFADSRDVQKDSLQAEHPFGPYFSLPREGATAHIFTCQGFISPTFPILDQALDWLLVITHPLLQLPHRVWAFHWLQ